MGNRRLELQAKLVQLLGSNHVYFQPPENIKMVYPCVVYESIRPDLDYADNRTYRYMKRYEITCISKNADDDLADRIVMHFPYCSFETNYISENLYHDVLNLYY